MKEQVTVSDQAQSNRAQHAKGQAMVEFVFALPILLLLIAGTIEFGRLMAVHSMINSASREAARFAASTGDAGPGTLRHYQDCDAIRASAVRVSEPLIAIDPSNIEIEYDSGPGTALLTAPGSPGCPPPVAQVGLGTRVIVRVSADYEPMVPLVPLGAMSISSETRRTLVTDVDTNP